MVVGQGPGYTAVTAGDPVTMLDLANRTDRWPMFVREVARLGVGAVFAFPLRVGGIKLGALDLYRHASEPLTAKTLTDATLLADLISYTLVDDLAADQTDRLPASTHCDVNVATDMIAARLGIPLEEAYLRLRAFAFGTGQPLRGVAQDVLRGHVDLDGAVE
jgi:hypothetical protein